MDIFEQTELHALDCYDQLLALGHLEMAAVQSPTSRALERSMCNVCHLTQILSAIYQASHALLLSCPEGFSAQRYKASPIWLIFKRRNVEEGVNVGLCESSSTLPRKQGSYVNIYPSVVAAMAQRYGATARYAECAIM